MLRAFLFVREQVLFQLASCTGSADRGRVPGDRPRDHLAVTDADEQLGRCAQQRTARPEVDREQVRRWVDSSERAVDLERCRVEREGEPAREDRLEHLTGVDLVDQLLDARLVPGVARRRSDAAAGLWTYRDRAFAAHAAPESVENRLEARVRALSGLRRERGRLRQVVERDHDIRHVEERLGQAHGIRVGHRDPLPARRHLVREIAHARIHREGEGDRHRPIDPRQHPAQCLERIRRGEPIHTVVVGVPDDRLVAVDDDRPAANPDERIAAVSSAAFDALEDECQAVAKPQRGSDGRQGVGADFDRCDRNRRLGRGRCECGHWSSLCELDCQVGGFEISLPTLADDLPGNRGFDHREGTPRLARPDVADVDLDHGLLRGHDRVVQRVAVVGVGARIDHDRVVVAVLEPVDQAALVVRLEVVDVPAARRRRAPGPRSTTSASVVEP